jgi:hypothetical protein
MLCVEGMIGGGNWYVWTKDGWYPEDEYENPVKFKTPNL